MGQKYGNQDRKNMSQLLHRVTQDKIGTEPSKGNIPIAVFDFNPFESGTA